MFDKKIEKSELHNDSSFEPNKKCSGKNLAFKIIALLLVVAVLGTIWGFGFTYDRYKSNQKIETLEKEVTKLQDTGVILSPVKAENVKNFIINKASELNELTTVDYIFTNTARFSNTDHISSLPYLWNQTSYIQQWNGTIKAGIDFSLANVTIKKKVITITIPYARVYSYEIDRNSIRVFDEANNVFKRVLVKEGVNFDRDTQYEMIDRAIKSGVLTKTQKKAKTAVKILLENTMEDFDDYKIKFKFVD